MRLVFGSGEDVGSVPPPGQLGGVVGVDVRAPGGDGVPAEPAPGPFGIASSQNITSEESIKTEDKKNTIKIKIKSIDILRLKIKVKSRLRTVKQKHRKPHEK